MHCHGSPAHVKNRTPKIQALFPIHSVNTKSISQEACAATSPAYRTLPNFPWYMEHGRNSQSIRLPRRQRGPASGNAQGAPPTTPAQPAPNPSANICICNSIVAPVPRSSPRRRDGRFLRQYPSPTRRGPRSASTGQPGRGEEGKRGKPAQGKQIQDENGQPG